MSTDLQVIPAAGEYTREKIELIKRTICAGSSDDELALFLHVARRTGLDPLARQIHAVKRWNAQAGREVMAVQTGIDGYRLIADRTGKLAGISDPIYDDESREHPGKATVTVLKLVDGLMQAFAASARWGEYVQTKKDGAPTSMWAKMPYLMLGKCAEALALRKAFPVDLSGVYTDEEMGQADNEGPGPSATGPGVTKNHAAVGINRSESTGAAADGAPPTVVRKSAKAIEGTVVERAEIASGPGPAQTMSAEQRSAAWVQSNGHDPVRHISSKQAGLLFVMKGKLNLSDEDLHDTVRDQLGVDHYNNIAKADFNKLLDMLDPEQQHHTNQRK